MYQAVPEVQNEGIAITKETRLFSDEYLELNIGKIKIPDLKQHRFDEGSIQKLAAKIREKGLLQPILVSAKGSDEKYQLIAGVRRLLACNMLGMSHVVARILNIAVIEDVP